MSAYKFSEDDVKRIRERTALKKIRGATKENLDQERARCRAALKSTKLKPTSIAYYERRLELIEAEMRRAAP
jgi:hypothetical protein